MSESFAVTNPATGELVETVQLAGPDEVDEAVRTARTAYADWSHITPAERSAALHRLAAELESTAKDLAHTESKQTGKPIKLSTEFDVPGTIDNTSFFAGAARHLDGLASGEYSADHTSSTRREPIGVVGSIAPWNSPLQMAAWKILPAIAAGNTIVLKPAEITPLTALMFAEACRAAGIPDGVVNVVVGTGPVAGEALVSHPDVDLVSFTGSTTVGRRVRTLAAEGMKRVHLELGGKAPFVVFDDAQLDAAVQGAVAGALINAGQDCTAATRSTRRRISTRSCHAASRNAWPASSNALAPTARRSSAAVGRPAVTSPAARTTSPRSAIELANDTPYGLAASAWTRDVYRAGRASRETRAGCVWINDHIPIASELPHGGYKQSGFGKDMSQYSLDEYTLVKHVMYDVTGVARKAWHRTIFGDSPR